MKTYQQLNGKDRNDWENMIDDFLKQPQNNFSKLEQAKNVFNKQEPRKDELNNPGTWFPIHWRWYFEIVKRQDLSPKVPLWKQAMEPWKKY